MNIFYTQPSQIYENRIELKGQEAIHASKVLRFGTGDEITVTDGKGKFYRGKVSRAVKDFVQVEISHITGQQARPKGRLAVGIIKKQARLEFVVEKAVELGIREIIFFTGEHSVKQNVRLERLKSVAISAMKQSLQAWLPTIHLFDTLEAVIHHYPECRCITARQSADEFLPANPKNSGSTLLLIGPEGGFSQNELSLLESHHVDFVSLSQNRLRTETAAISMLVQFFFSFCTR